MDFQNKREYNKMGDLSNLLHDGPEERSLKAKVNELDNEYIVEIKLIGFDKDEILIFIEDDILFVEANREDILDEDNDDYTIQEHSYAYCQRSFSLQGVDRTSISAYYENNYVYLHLPKI